LTEHDVENRIGPAKAQIDPDQCLLEWRKDPQEPREDQVPRDPALGEAPETVAAISGRVQRKAR
jgi:hypothetical protein